MDLGLANKVALVSGGSKGIGRAIAMELAQEGVKVGVVARSREGIDDAVAAIRSVGGTAIGISADMTARSEVERAVSVVTGELGEIGIAVFNVYGPTSGTYDAVEDDDLKAAFNDMVLSLHWLTRSVLPGMRAARWGRLVTVNSVSSKEVHRELPLFTANPSRVAAVSFNKTLSAEVAADGITVNTIGVGRIQTERFRAYMTQRAQATGRTYEEVRDERGSAVPVGRLGEPHELAAVAAFLCSERASFVTGQFIVVDGGLAKTLW